MNDSPIEEVRLTVPITDDPTLPCLTFRTWVLGVLSCAALAFLNRFFGYRQNALSVTSVSAQILVLPLGKLMAATLPTKAIQILWTKWSFSLNPGPFNRAIQLKRALPHHHLRQCRLNPCLCSQHYHHCQSILSSQT